MIFKVGDKVRYFSDDNAHTHTVIGVCNGDLWLLKDNGNTFVMEASGYVKVPVPDTRDAQWNSVNTLVW